MPSLSNVLLLLCSSILLWACATDGNPVVQTMQATLKRGKSADEPKLNPNLRYLRVTIEGRVAFLALGYLDSHAQGTIEVWYSGDREVVRLLDGRLVGATGLAKEWRTVALPELPDWSNLAASKQTFTWVRVRDVMPGYRYGVRDSLELSVTQAPARSALQGIDPASLTWFEERLVGEVPKSLALPPARYAVQTRTDGALVVYAEQCIAADTCFTWQRWPAGS